MTAAGALLPASAGSPAPLLWIVPVAGYVAVLALFIRATVVADRNGKLATEVDEGERGR
ncbi:hypothetical protein HNR23_003165 [Nocardiopsis mwathae]|uniref:Uncharacterized protein n=1 Tax=Nocardiopsis mwathae TaxID=1472723 RepID=A0A7X0D6C0_9ACTN|nr:hypothetical protein [Nocardiopsis mwathae]MBB6173105.1 hypothetical protein [Nocardiopsis mwathae]